MNIWFKVVEMKISLTSCPPCWLNSSFSCVHPGGSDREREPQFPQLADHRSQSGLFRRRGAGLLVPLWGRSQAGGAPDTERGCGRTRPQTHQRYAPRPPKGTPPDPPKVRPQTPQRYAPKGTPPKPPKVRPQTPPKVRPQTSGGW